MTRNVPGWLPVAVGVKMMVIVHFAPAGMAALQVSSSEYPALGTKSVNVSVALPELVSVMYCGALDLLIA